MYKRNLTSWVKHLDFIVIDIILLEICFYLAYVIRHGEYNPYAMEAYTYMAIAMALIDIVVISACKSFKNVLKRGYYLEFRNLLKQTIFVMVFSVFFSFMIKNTAEYSRLVIFITAGLYFVISYVVRIALKKGLLTMANVSKRRRRVMVLATKDTAEKVITDIRSNKTERFAVSGVMLIDSEPMELCDVITMKPEDGISYACREWVDGLFISIPHGYEFDTEIVAKFVEMGIPVHYSMEDMVDIGIGGGHVEKVCGQSVITMGVNTVSAAELFIKRLMDICGGIAGCIITAIIFVVIGPIIYMKSPGPIFFAQTRIGKNGERFKIYKFRSMYMDAEERKKELMAQNKVQDGMMFKMENDPRIIGSEKGPGKGIGNFIRKTSLDEFPQFYNVLKGDMSIIGTRPPTVDEWEKYELHHRARMSTRPGITGMWQVSGRSEITDFEEVVKLDRKYITEWNLGLDIKILLKTVLVVLGKKGSM